MARFFRTRRPWAVIGAILLGLIGGGCVVFGALLLGVGLENNRFYDALNRELVPAGAPAEERVLATFARVSNWTYFDVERIDSRVLRVIARFEHASPFHVSARTVLTGGADRTGTCGSLSRTMIVLLRRAGIRARKAILYTQQGRPVHTVVEVLLDREWRVFDPTCRWYWRRPWDGGIATTADLAVNRSLFETVAAARPDYPLGTYTYGNVHHLRWEKLPGLPWVRERLRGWLGAAWVRAVGTPYLYERPPLLVGGGFLFAGGALLLVLWRCRARGAGSRRGSYRA